MQVRQQNSRINTCEDDSAYQRQIATEHKSASTLLVVSCTRKRYHKLSCQCHQPWPNSQALKHKWLAMYLQGAHCMKRPLEFRHGVPLPDIAAEVQTGDVAEHLQAGNHAAQLAALCRQHCERPEAE